MSTTTLAPPRVGYAPEPIDSVRCLDATTGGHDARND